MVSYDFTLPVILSLDPTDLAFQILVPYMYMAPGLITTMTADALTPNGAKPSTYIVKLDMFFFGTLTQCGLLKSNGNIDLGQYWLR